MAITLWRTLKPFERLSRNYDYFDEWFDSDFLFPTKRKSWSPPVDIEEKDGNYLLKADIPGLNKKDIHVELHDGYLTLKGERKSEHEDKKDGFHRVERTYGSFSRSFKVPDGISNKDIKARYHDGVLEVSVPASRVEKPKAIDVKVE